MTREDLKTRLKKYIMKKQNEEETCEIEDSRNWKNGTPPTHNETEGVVASTSPNPAMTPPIPMHNMIDMS